MQDILSTQTFAGTGEGVVVLEVVAAVAAVGVRVLKEQWKSGSLAGERVRGRHV